MNICQRLGNNTFFSSFLLLLARLRMLVPWRTPWHLLNRPVFWLMICSSGKKELFEANLVWLCLTYILLTNQHFWPISADVLSIEVQREQLGRSKWCNSKLGQTNLQGDPNQNSTFLTAITQKLSISDPKLVKPKCVWEAVVFFNFPKFVYIFQLFAYNFSKKLPFLKHILALPT